MIFLRVQNEAEMRKKMIYVDQINLNMKRVLSSIKTDHET
jgi:hypothetical protein